MTSRAQKRQLFLDALLATGKTQVTKVDVIEIAENLSIPVPQWFVNDESNKVKRGVYRVPNAPQTGSPAVAMMAQVIPLAQPTNQSGNRITNVTTDLETENLIPSQYANYVPFGNFDDVLSIVQSNMFFPVFVTGHSGNGKTMSIEQACAKAKRKFVCVSMTQIGRAHV